MIHHVGFEVSDLERSGRFYDAVLHAIGARRLHSSDHAIAWGVDGPELWITARSEPGAGYGHVALSARGRAAVDAAHAAGLERGGADDGPPAERPQYGAGYYAAYLRDPDGLRVEVVSAGR